MTHYIGLMSGTSVDGMDAVLISCTDRFEKLIDHYYLPFPECLQNKLLVLQQSPSCSLEDLGRMDRELADCYAEAVQGLLKKTALSASAIRAIGCHGQTVFHAPSGPYPFSMQIGDPNTLAEKTGIAVVADFRRMDMACGGEGAPLVPHFHAALFPDDGKARAVVNLGGIANSTLFRPDRPLTGFDHGPASCLMDAWIHSHYPDVHFDDGGSWAASGKIHEKLLADMLADPYFKRTPPKSTGKEYFNLVWLHNHLDRHSFIQPEDVQATLCELTATVIGMDMKQHMGKGCGIYVCGGGAKNEFLMKRLSIILSSFTVTTTESLGIPVDCMEAAAFAWLAFCRINGCPGNVPSVTGASRQALLGGVYDSFS